MADRLSLAHRAWRALPARARRDALRGAAGLVAPRADKTPPARSRGVVVAGELHESSGVAEAARLLLAGCERLGLARGGLGLRVGGQPQGELPPQAALLLAVNAPSIPLMLARAGKNFLRGRRVIGDWAWELPEVPKSWEVGGRYVHEAWACSPFTAAALERLMPGRVRMVPYPLALVGVPQPAADRAAFGLPAQAVVTVMVFSLGSSFTRKNPLAAMRAFARAFGDRDDHILVIKFSGAAAFPREAAEIEAAAAANMRVFSGSWPAGRVEALLACADIVLSLHRSEGFGLVPAQAMLRGIPVVATGWSGNMAFMDETSAELVGYELVPVDDATGVYERMPGVRWAEPDIGHAAELLRRLGDDAAWRAALGARGQAHATRALNGAELRSGLAANGIDGA